MKKIIILNEQRITLLEDECPVNLITDMGELSKDYEFILESGSISRLMLGRMKKIISINGASVTIRWPITKEEMKFREIDKTHRYLLTQMKVITKDKKCFKHIYSGGEISAIIIAV